MEAAIQETAFNWLDDNELSWLDSTSELGLVVPKGDYTRTKEYADLKFLEGLSATASARTTSERTEEVKQFAFMGVDQATTIYQQVESGASAQEIQEAFDKNLEIDRALRRATQFSTVDAAMAEDPTVTASMFRINNRLQEAKDTMANYYELSKRDEGWVHNTLEFVDNLVGSLYTDIKHSLDKEEAGLATSISNDYLHAAANLSDEAWADFLRERQSTLENNALFGPDNDWAIGNELASLDSLGYIRWDKEMSASMAVLSAVDVATLGFAGTRALARVGRSVIGRNRAAGATAWATEEATRRQGAMVVREARGEVLDPIDVIEDLSSSIPGRTEEATPFSGRDSGPRIDPNIEEAEILDDIAPGNLNSNAGPNVAPPVSQGAVNGGVAANSFIERFRLLQGKGSFGVTDTLENAAAWMAREALRLADAHSSSVIDTLRPIDEGMSNYRLGAILGKENGADFSSFAGASKVADEMPGAKVIDRRTGDVLTEDNGSGAYGVLVEKRYDVSEGIGPLSVGNKVYNNAFAEFLAGILSPIKRTIGSTNVNSSTLLNNLADAAERGGSGFMVKNAKAIQAATKIPVADARVLDEIMLALRDDVNINSAHQWFNPEVIARSYQTLTGKQITHETMLAYETIVELADFSWWVTASQRLQNLAKMDAIAIDLPDGLSVLARPSKLNMETLAGLPTKWVYDVASGSRKAAGSLPNDVVVYQLVKPMSNQSEYIVNFSGSSRLPNLSDAYPYNAGGFRDNPDIKYFIGSRSGGWATLLGARTNKQAQQTVGEVNTITSTIKRMVGEDVTKTEDILNKLTTLQKTELDDLIRVNNNWNTSIEGLDDMAEFADGRGVSLVDEVQAKGRDENVGEALGLLGDDVIDLTVSKMIQYSRHSRVLREFGGARVENPNPMVSIINRFESSVSKGAGYQYSTTHATSWVKAVEQARGVDSGLGVVWTGGPATDVSKVQNMVIQGKTPTAIRLRNEQEIILRRMGLLKGSYLDTGGSKIGAGWANIGDVTKEAIHNGNFYPTIDRMLLGATDLAFTGVSKRLMSMGFLRMMTTIDQTLIQGSAVSIVMHTTALTTQAGFKAVFVASAVRMAARKGGTGMWDDLSKQLGKVIGYSSEQMDELIEHLDVSGAGYMKGAIADDPTASAMRASTIGGRLKDVASIPYYAGENFVATVSRIAAYMDTVTALPNEAVTSNKFISRVQRRDRDFFMAMNSAQKSRLQTDSWTRVATQWSSFQLHSMETVLDITNSLTKRERASMLYALTLQFGLVGAVGYSAAKAVLPEDTPEWMADSVIFGLQDAIIRRLGGVSLSTRLSVTNGMVDRLKGYVSEAPLDSVPGLGFMADLGGLSINLVGNLINSQRSTSLFQYDIEMWARQFKAVDSIFLAKGMYLEHARLTKTGGNIPAQYTNVQVALQAIGLTPKEAVDYGLDSGRAFDLDSQQWGASKRLVPLMTRALKAFDKGDMAAANDLFVSANMILTSYQFTPTVSSNVMDSVIGKIGQKKLERLVLKLAENGLMASNSVLQGAITQGNRGR